VRDLSRQPVFQTAFALQDVSIESIALSGLVVRPLDEEVTSARFDLELSMTEVAGELSATLNYATDLFDAATIERLAVICSPAGRTGGRPGAAGVGALAAEWRRSATSW